MELVWIGSAGLVGVFGRYFIALAMGPRDPGGFPWATFAVNMAGSFLIGLVLAQAGVAGRIPPQTRDALTIGFLGGFTTFSAFSAESFLLLQNGHKTLALIYMALSMVGGLAAIFLGFQVGRLV